MLAAADTRAQAIPTVRLSILQAEERRAPTAGDLLIIRNGIRLGDPETVRIAVRALGRLERPSLIPDLLGALHFPVPEVRAEAANAVAQAAQGWKVSGAQDSAASRASAQAALIARLGTDDDPTVRAALCETLARIPYRDAPEIERVEQALSDAARRNDTITDRLGVAKGFEALTRLQPNLRPTERTVALLEELARGRPQQDPARDVRVRRLALQSLISAGALHDDGVDRAAADGDPQVRRLAVRAAAANGRGLEHVRKGLGDPAGMVRLEALSAMRSRGLEAACPEFLRFGTDLDLSLALAAIDQLGACGKSQEAVALLDRIANYLAAAAAPRGWQRPAHALLSLAAAAPDRAAAVLGQFTASATWPLRMYAARAAAILHDRPTLETLAGDPDDRVANAALSATAGSPRPSKTVAAAAIPPTAAELRRLAAPRARVTISHVGRFDLALFTSEAPATVLRFAQLAETGYYDGMSIDRVLADGLIQSRGRSSTGARSMRDEVGLWPHVRGAVGISTEGRDTGDGHFFIDVVDNPQFDHTYTVFAQVLNGIEVVDQILDGDVIESIEILP
jgi:cyclophilin family peptidyl-prolyl cis-trans isomerase